MMVLQTTPFEQNISEQPAALRRLGGSLPTDLGAITTTSWSRIVITGMGSSHFAGLPTFRRLATLGRPAWAIDTGQLLETDGLITDQTLLIITSQSGASGEIVELLRRREQGEVSPALLVAITNDKDSRLATAADVVLSLHSGEEATVSTKSYLNTLAVHRLLRAAFAGEDLAEVRTEITDAADAVQLIIDTADLTEVATAAATHADRRIAFIGAGDSGGTAQFAALITKESAKLAAEGYVGGQFRHGPFELAGEGLTAVIFASTRGGAEGGLRTLATDLVRTGSRVIVIGDPDAESDLHVPIGGTSELAFAAASSVAAELLAVQLARANGVVPGAFIHGSKITTTI